MAALTKAERAGKDLYLESQEFTDTAVEWKDLTDEEKAVWIAQADAPAPSEPIPPKPTGAPELGNKDPEVIAWNEKYNQ